MNNFWITWFNIDPNHVLRSLVYDIWPNIAASAILGTAIFWKIYRVHKCKSCWRIGRIPVKGTHYKTCLVHTTAEDHAELLAHHKHDHPKLNAFLNKDHYER